MLYIWSVLEFVVLFKYSFLNDRDSGHQGKLCVFFKCNKLTDSRREKDSRLVLNQPEYMNSITLMLLTL